MRANFTWGTAAVLLLLAASFPAASAEPYPLQRITLIVLFPPGSATDSVTRHLAESIRAATNATVVVDRFRAGQAMAVDALRGHQLAAVR